MIKAASEHIYGARKRVLTSERVNLGLFSLVRAQHSSYALCLNLQVISTEARRKLRGNIFDSSKIERGFKLLLSIVKFDKLDRQITAYLVN